jgi:pyruvate/2-oxoglutarate dehydrogenase complex dihydrolipoamide dehydrogenase (E3) component
MSAKRIFIAAGTRPAAPPIAGLDEIDYLTNENIFHLERVPQSLLIIGGGAIGCEMAQAFRRLGAEATIVHMDPHLVPVGEPDAAALLEEQFEQEGIKVYNGRSISRVAQENGHVALYTDKDERLTGERLLVAAGRRFDFSSLKLENAGVKWGKRGIEVNSRLQTSQKHIYAVGDCNGHHLLSHAAMHQGMIALMNAMMPFFMKMNFRKFVVPWTVFTEPQISHAGMTEQQLQEKGINYETIVIKYEDYGAAIAEAVDVGFVKVFASKAGRIFGASIVGEGSGEMINEWALAIQEKVRMHKLMLLQHSFPTMGFLSKRAAETWMMNRMQSGTVKKMAQLMYRL